LVVIYQHLTGTIKKRGKDGEHRVQAYNGGLGWSPQWGPEAQPWSGVKPL